MHHEPTADSGQRVGSAKPASRFLHDKALWSIALPVFGFVSSIAGLRLSDHFGSSSTISGIQQNDAAGADAFLVVGVVDLVVGAVAIAFAVSARRAARASATGAVPGDRSEVAVVGLVLGCVIVLGGIAALAVGVLLRSLNALTF